MVDVRQRAAEAAVADAEEIVVVGRGPELGDEGDCVQAAAVVVDLPLNTLELATVDVVPEYEIVSQISGLKRDLENSPVAAGVSIVAPVRNGRLVGEN